MSDGEVAPHDPSVKHIRAVNTSALHVEVDVSVRTGDGTTRVYVREWGIRGGCRQVGLILTDEKREELIARLSAPAEAGGEQS